jgi:hypothetical protein
MWRRWDVVPAKPIAVTIVVSKPIAEHLSNSVFNKPFTKPITKPVAVTIVVFKPIIFGVSVTVSYPSSRLCQGLRLWNLPGDHSGLEGGGCRLLHHGILRYRDW